MYSLCPIVRVANGIASASFSCLVFRFRLSCLFVVSALATADFPSRLWSAVPGDLLSFLIFRLFVGVCALPTSTRFSGGGESSEDSCDGSFANLRFAIARLEYGLPEWEDAESIHWIGCATEGPMTRRALMPTRLVPQASML